MLGNSKLRNKHPGTRVLEYHGIDTMVRLLEYLTYIDNSE